MAKTGKDKSLVIVESPAKAKTINKYLGPDFEVKASMGHIRDLPSKGLNVDLDHNFEPTYEITTGRKKTVAVLKAEAKKCSTVYLATDLDREGEAIAWHLAEVLGLKEENTFRVVFNAITKNDIQKAFSSPGKVDMHRVMAQQARRILDRIVGYQISPLLWKKVAKGLSAGRVQSVAVKLIVQREREIRSFDPKEYWLIPGVFSTKSQTDLSDQWKAFIGSDPDNTPVLAKQNAWLARHDAFKAELYSVNGQSFHADNETQAKAVLQAVQGAAFTIGSLTTNRVQSRPGAPFITSTLQQAAANRLGFSASKTMMLAQQLYEGIDLGSMGALGLITYMRTDSTHLSYEAIQSVRHYIEHQYGKNYLPEKPNFFSSSKDAQQAHEAIRPTDPDLTPDDIRQFLTDDQFKLYDLIWRRFVACQMAAAQWDTTRAEIIAKTAIGPCAYRASGRVQVFDGFTKIWSTATEEPVLPEMAVGQAVLAVWIDAQQHFTKPPARYTEASLVKALEKEGIGRPSTYASIISTIQDRQYVEKKDKKFFATQIGEIVTDKLDEFFPQVMDIAFTRHMEEQLDKIEDQHLEWVSVLKEFYTPFCKSLENAKKEMVHAKAETQPSEYKCPQCGEALVYRFGKNGRFLSCSKYPDCKFACPCDNEGKMVQETTTEHPCPNCGKPLVQKRGRFGTFLGCSDYPTCKTIVRLDKQGQPLPPKPPAQPTGITCHKCGKGELVIRQSKRGPFLGCNRFPRCRTIVKMDKLELLKELQSKGQWPPKDEQQAKEILGGGDEQKKSSRKKSSKTNSQPPSE
ncbi:MAG: type I DNA topoisomerase [Sedimentisphaerales bacterium]|nr:type I DNA topoisomerase [Sedimentisphaerales bacterium]